MRENDNRIPVEVLKADMTVQDMRDANVVLHPDMRDQFIVVAIKGPYMMGRIRVTTMSRESEDIPKLTTFGSQVLHPAVEGQALAVGNRSTPGYSRVRLTSQEFGAQINFPRYALKMQTEMEGFRNTLLSYAGLHIQRDLENLAVNGDTTSTNDLLSMFNGMIEAMSTNSYDANGASLSSSVLDNLEAVKPDEYMDDGAEYFTNRRAHANLHREYEQRGTQLGDLSLVNGTQLAYRGTPVHRVPMFPNNLSDGGMAANGTVCLYFNPVQYILAFHEDIEIDSEYDRGSRTWQVFINGRVALGFEHEPACAKATEILGQ